MMLNLYLRVRNALEELKQRQEGAALAEYGLLIALIAVIAIVALTALGGNIAAKFQEIADAL